MNYFYTVYFSYENIVNFVFFIILTIALASLIKFIFRNFLLKITSKTESSLDDEIVKITQKPVYWGVILVGFYFALRQLTILSQHISIIASIIQVVFIIILLVTAVKISRVLFGWANGKKLKKKQVGFMMVFEKIINFLIYFLAIIFILQVAGISIAPLVASLGVGGLVLGLALQPTLSNYFSGLYVVSEGFIKPDDFIELDSGLRGYVVNVGWRNTIIRLWDNNLVMIPNSKMADTAITNYNEPQNKTSFIVQCGVAYNTDLKKAEKIALETANKIQNKKKYGAKDYKPVLRFYEFDDSNINLKVIMQAGKYPDHHEMKHDFIKELKSAYDKAGIVISFPMRTVEFTGSPLEISIKNK